MREPEPHEAQVNWLEVSEEFEKLLAMPASGRAARLGHLRNTNPALLKEVQSLLMASESAGDFLDELAQPPLDFGGEETTGTGVVESSHPPPGTRIGSWEVLETIGQGGMGGVYRVRRIDGPFEQVAALKLIRKGFDTDDLVRRFVAERQILASLEHPGIARLIDGGAAPDGRPFLVMEFVRGEPLLDFATGRQLDVPARLKLFREICEAVQYAHRNLIVHRDLKPSNILVTEDSSVRLLDFGISKVLSSDGSGLTLDLTGPLAIMTPEYASPEQVRGESVNTSSDVYSLGVILYELVSGQKPYRFRTRSITEILKVLTGPEPRKPSAAADKPHSRMLAGDLDNIIQKAMARDVDRRYGSVEQLSEDLRRFLAGEPVLARPATATYQLSKFVGRNRLAVGAAAALALALIAGLASTAWQARLAREQRDRAEKRFDEVRGLARSVVFELHDAIKELPGSNAARKVLVDKALEYYNSLAAEMPDDPVLRQEMVRSYLRIGDVQGFPQYPNLGQSQQAMVSFRRSVELARRNVLDCPDSMNYVRDLLNARHRTSIMWLSMGHGDSARVIAELNHLEAEDLFRRFPNEPLPADLLSVMCGSLQEVLLVAGDTLSAERIMNQRIGASRRALQLRPDNEVYQESYLIDLYMAAMFAENRRDWSLVSQLIRPCVLESETRHRTSPGNSTTMRQLAIFYEVLSKVHLHTAMPESAFILLEKRQALMGGLAAADPTDHQIQSDLADGEILLAEAILLTRGPADALPSFEGALRRYQAASAADTSDLTVVSGVLVAAVKLGDCQLALAGSDGDRRVQLHKDALTSYKTARQILSGVAARGPLPSAMKVKLDEVESRIVRCRQVVPGR